MSFTYPLGLLVLVGIPIVILIYILRSKYNEQTVTSTFIWKLSERFLKKRNPLSGLTGLISLLLQILIITVTAIAIAHPVFTLPGAAHDYCFVLDTTGSMNMKEGRTTRIELAKEEIEDVIRGAADGSTYTLSCVAGDTVKMFEGVTNKDKACELVESIEAEYTSADTAETLKVAQKYFDANTSALVYLVTDKTYGEHENIEIIKVGKDGHDNYAVSGVTYSHTAGELNVTADVISYAKDATLTVEIYLDGASSPAAFADVSVKAGEKTAVELGCETPRFSSFRTAVKNSDGYGEDNGIITYNIKNDKTYSTLIVSETGFFFRAIIDAYLDSEVTVITPEEYPTHEGSYGLYIFDCYTPDSLPEGAVWLVNCTKSIENSGFGLRGLESAKDGVGEIVKSSSTASSVRKLLAGVDGTGIYISEYVKYSGMYLKFNTLFTYDSNPVIFAGTNGEGYRQVVFGFDLHDSDIALNPDFVILMRNLLDYSFPSVIDKSGFTVGEEAVVNVVAGAEAIKAHSPSGKEIYAESDGSTATFPLDEVGTYTVSMKISGADTSYSIYAAAHPAESAPTVREDSFSLSGERTYEKRDGEYDPTLILFICLALLFIADWGLFCYEKYQLR